MIRKMGAQTAPTASATAAAAAAPLAAATPLDNPPQVDAQPEPTATSLPQDGQPLPRYRAFVSYRHADVDSKVAAAIQRGLERFYVPKAVRGASGSARIAPVFRDKEELPVSARLGDDIAAALRDAESLVVVCSPRTQESAWVAREIDEFLAHHDRDRVFVVLAEGEPANVVPPRLLQETRTTTAPDGSLVEELVDVEPLACDYRASARKERRTELTRLAAAILGVPFDALMRRTQRRRARITAGVATAVTSVAVAVAAYALWSNARIKESYRETLLQQSRSLTTTALEELAEGDRLAAIELASAALPQPGEDRPLYPEALHTLGRTSLAYDDGNDERTWASSGLVAKYHMSGTVTGYAISPQARYLAAVDSHNALRAWSLEADEVVFETTLPYAWSKLVVSDEGRLAVSDWTGLTCYDLASGAELWSLKVSGDLEPQSYPLLESPLQLVSDHELAVVGLQGTYLIDLATGSVLQSVPYGDSSPAKASFLVEGGWNPATRQLLVGMQLSYDASKATLEGEASQEPAPATVLVDFSTCSATRLAGVDGYAQSALFLGDGTVVVAGGPSIPGNALTGETLRSSTTVAQVSYSRKAVRVRTDGSGAVWEHSTQAWAYPLADALVDLGQQDRSFGGRHVVARCLANVCELFDAETGEALRRVETPSPIAQAWPSTGEDAALVLEGVLDDGSKFGIWGSDSWSPAGGGVSRSSLGRYVSAPESARSSYARIADGVLATSHQTIYRFVDVLEPVESEVQEAYARSDESEPLFDTLATPYGTLMLEYRYGTGGVTLSLLGGAEGIVWTRTVEPELGYEPNALGRLETGHVCLVFSGVAEKPEYLDQSTAQEYYMASKVVVIDPADSSEVASYLTKGSSYYEAEEFENADSVLYPHDCAVGGHFAANCLAVASMEGDEYRQMVHIAMTDLLTGDSVIYPIDDLGEEMAYLQDAYWSVSPQTWSVSPSGDRLLIPLDDSSAHEGEFAPYAIVDLAARSISPLEEPIKMRLGTNGACAAWSQDGSRLACVSRRGIEVLDAKGGQVFSAALEGRDVIAARFCSGKLLAICSEGADTTLVSYDLEAGAMDGHATLLEGESGMDARAFQWLEVSSGPRDPGDLCILARYRGLFLVSVEPFGVCQEVTGCVGYDEASRTFLVEESHSGGERYAFLSYPRLTIDDLLERGEAQVGTSAMPVAERQAYGLPTE